MARSFFIILLVLPISSGQLLSSERRILFRLQQVLEFPPALQGWTNWTNFCGLTPSSSLTIVCSDNHITELTVIGNKTSSSLISPKPNKQSFKVSEQTLSEKFSTDTFFTTLTKLSSLKVLSLVSLGLWGSLPPKINRLQSLQVLNLSSNFIYGEVPPEVVRLMNLRSLVLADNMFNGLVPDLSPLPVLEEVNVGGNFLGPRLPTLGNKLVSVVLKNNTFRSELPLELGKFVLLHRLDVSYNDILGRIPSALFSLPSLEYINLAGNGLMGALPTNTSCSSALKFVDLSDNLLVGDLPSCIRYNSSTRAVLYTWNCLSTGDLKYQHPNSFCHEKALAVKPPTQEQNKRSSSKAGLLIGTVGAVLGGLMVLCLIAFIVFRKMGARETENNTSKNSVADKSLIGLSPKLVTDARNVSSAMMFGALGLPQYHVFSLEEIEEATNNFDSSNLIGEGSHGQIYKAWLTDGSAAVVKCLKLKQKHSSQTLGRHMEVLSKLRHQHLVSVLGHTLITHQEHPNAANTFLVLEYVSNGTLQSHLTDPRKREALKWPERMAVTIGVARGLQFLHSGVTPGLFGNNLKTENILLDENLKAKISNYNIPLSSMVESESLYNGDEATANRHNSNMHSAEDGAPQDVYQLGSILLELITGKQITSQSQLDVHRIQLEQGLADSPSQLHELVDASIRNTLAYESLRTTVQVTINCLSKDPSQRPSIEDVLWNLQYSVQVQEGWMPSGDSFSANRSF
ncbi:Receptor-like protein kinase [Thalictrum thalictroides]|uniref:non-specific serine/threonine protein kinase n=1 Tax=Thalictrum thalictroides TaxID=46969 RepID=A0A7J6WRX5_THATH|nr:Receptor-like protein kinase [Thalictrum thalictroides]